MAPMEEFIEMLKSHNRIVFFGGAECLPNRIFPISAERRVVPPKDGASLVAGRNALPSFLCGASRGIFHTLQRERRYDAGSGTEPGAYGAGGIGKDGEVIRRGDAEY